MNTQTVLTLKFCDGVDMFANKAALCKRQGYVDTINLDLEQKIDDLGTLTDDELVPLVKDRAEYVMCPCDL